MSEQNNIDRQVIRKIIHIDMDAYFASIEQRDNQQLKGKPVIVGGNPNSRGVVATCSYEARKFGIHSAMSSAKAYKLCPEAVFVRPRFEIYQKVSHQIREIFKRFTDLIEPLSLDEAFLDVTENKTHIYATDIAIEILKVIFNETGLTASAGVSFNKFLAKIASDYRKPNGITVVTPKVADKFIESLQIRKFFGIGKVTEKKMHKLGIRTGADLKKIGKTELINSFGKAGGFFYEISRGIDNRPVNPHRERKSIGNERTLNIDTDKISEMITILEKLAENICSIMEKKEVKGYCVTLKVKYSDFRSITRCLTLQEPIFRSSEIIPHINALLKKTEAGTKKVRLLGISISKLIS